VSIRVDYDYHPDFAIGQCPCCGAKVDAGEPVGHWHGGPRTAGFTYSATCSACGTLLVGTGQAGGPRPDVIVWTRADEA
jgi:hypothetical protein